MIESAPESSGAQGPTQELQCKQLISGLNIVLGFVEPAFDHVFHDPLLNVMAGQGVVRPTIPGIYELTFDRDSELALYRAARQLRSFAMRNSGRKSTILRCIPARKAKFPSGLRGT